MGSMIVAQLFLLLIIADVLVGAVLETSTWILWRQEVRFKRRYSISDPMSFGEFRHWLDHKRGHSTFEDFRKWNGY